MRKRNVLNVLFIALLSCTLVHAQHKELDKAKVEQTTFPYNYTVDGNVFQITESDLNSETIDKYVMIIDKDMAERYVTEKKQSIQKRISTLADIKSTIAMSTSSKSIAKSIFLQVYGRFQENLVSTGLNKKALNAIYRAQESFVGDGKTPKEMLTFLDVYLSDVDAEIADLTRIMSMESTEDFLSASDYKSSTLVYEVKEGSGDRASYYQDRMFQKVRHIYPFTLRTYAVPTKSEKHSFANPFWHEVEVEQNQMDSQEWSWVNERLDEVSKSYPIKDSYLVHKEHPNYQVREVRYTGRQVFDGEKLLYMSLELRTNQTYDLISSNKLIMAIMRKAYQENKYNFKSESADAQMVVQVRTGLYYDYHRKELMQCILGKRYFIDSDMAQYGMNEFQFREMVTPANRYETQLTEDYKNQLSSIKVKRISNTSFLYYSTDGKLEIKEEWNSTGNSVCTVLKY